MSRTAPAGCKKPRSASRRTPPGKRAVARRRRARARRRHRSLWHVCAGPSRPALLLGPLAVHPDWRQRGIGAALVRRALADARVLGHGAVLLVGDACYYGRFGFSVEKTGGLWMPGRYDRDRLLAHELRPGALDGARGLISPTGQLQRKPDLEALIAAVRGGERSSCRVPVNPRHTAIGRLTCMR